MDHVAIIGLGLMGGSLGLALKSRGHPGRITGFTRDANRRAIAQERGAVDAAFDNPSDAVKGADLVVFCAPILAIPGLVRATLPAMKKDCVITDVGSTKAHLVRELSALTPNFVGSHPIAGSEQQGIDAAVPGLYERATVVVTPVKGSPEESILKIERLWKGVGSDVYRMDPEEHDRMLALTSHLPHLAAALLVATVARGKGTNLAAFCGSGFRDTTRVAKGSPELWDDIMQTNQAHVLEELKSFGQEVNDLVAHLEAKDFSAVRAFLEKARDARRGLVK